MRRLIFAFFILLITAVSIGLVQFTSINMEVYNHTQEQIARLKDKHIELNVNILRTNLRLNQNYDPLIVLQKQIEALQLDIGRVEISDSFTRHFNSLAAVSQTKFELLEQFKSDYAILQNAEMRLPAITSKLLADASVPNQLNVAINSFLNHLFF